MYRIRKLTRDALLISVGLLSFLLLFALQNLLSEKIITGDVIQVGRPNVVIVEPPKATPPSNQEPVDPKKQCWLQRGIREEDYAIIGPLLQQTSCVSGGNKQPVSAQKNNNCINVKVGDDATTSLCIDQEEPAFTIELPTPSQHPVVAPPTKRNYWLAFLILFMGLCILFIWGRADLYSATHRRTSQDFSRLLPGHKEVQIRYIKPPPLYVKKSEPVPEKPVVHVQAPVVMKTPEQKVLSSPLNKSLVKFNALSQDLCDLIAEKKFTEAEQRYPELYRLALELYPNVTDENKPRLLKVVTSLHEQLQDVRKAYAMVQDVKDIYTRDEKKEQVSVPVWEPAKMTIKKEQIKHLDQELSRLRQLLGEHTPSGGIHSFKKKFWH